MDDEIGDRDHEIIPPDQGQEFIGTEQSALGMLPTQQGLDANNSGGEKVEFGLVKENEFTLIERIMEFGKQSNGHRTVNGSQSSVAFGQSLVDGIGQLCLGTEDVHPCRTGAFARIHCTVSLIEQLLT